MTRKISGLCTFILAAVLLSQFAVFALAQSPAIGVVDKEKVKQNYAKFQDQIKALGAEVQAKQKELNELLKLAILPDDKWAEAKVLLDKDPAKLTQDDLKKLQALSQEAQDLESQFRQLQAKAQSTMTPEEKQLFQAVTQRLPQRNKELQDFQNTHNALYHDKYGAILTTTDAQISTTVEQVAQQKKLAIVIERGAVLYGGIDITDEVLKLLNDAYEKEKASPPAATSGEGTTGGGNSGGSSQ